MANPHNIPITIANILIELQSPISAAELGIEKRLGDFLEATQNPIGTVSLCWEASDGPPPFRGELLYDPGSIWRVYRDGQDFFAVVGYPHGPREDEPASVQAVLKANASWDKLRLTEHRSGPQWTSLLNTGVGELILRTSMLFTDGLVFHASGIDDNGRGIVFVGHAGEGKSTQAGFWSGISGAVAMNDDRIAVRYSPDGAVCYGTPWGGTPDFARYHHAPCSTIILIEQGLENFIEPLPSSVAAPMLLARAFLPYWDQGLMELAVGNLNKILSTVPVFRLRCRPEPSIVSLVRSVL